MRIFVSFIFIFVFILSLLYLLLFTSSGNSLLKPYLEEIASKELEHNVTIDSIVIKPDFLDLEIVIDKRSRIVLNGDIEIFSQTFDLTYNLNIVNLKTPYIFINSRIKMEGNLKGDMKLFDITGEGEAFRSKVNFKTVISNNKIKDLKIFAKALKIEDILRLLNKPIYTRGIFDINIDVISDQNREYNGKIDTIIQFGVLNKSVIKDEYDIDLKRTINYRGEIHSKIIDSIVRSKVDIYSNIVNIKLENSSFNVKNSFFATDFIMEIPKLSLLKPIIKRELFGKVTITGNVKKGEDGISFDAHTKKFNGNIDVKFIQNRVKILLNELKVSDILKMLKIKRYLNANLDASIDIEDIHTLESSISLNMKNGRVYPNKIEELLGITIPIDTTFSLESRSFIKSNLLHVKMKLFSNIFNLDTNDTIVSLKGGDYNGTYHLEVPKLQKLEFLTKRRLRGDLALYGDFYSKNSMLIVEGKSDFLDSNSMFFYKENNLNIDIQNISTKKLSYMLYFPEVFDSIAKLSVNYNFRRAIGSFYLDSNNGKIAKNTLGDLIYDMTRFDITKEIYNKTKLKGSIDKNIVDFDLDMNSSNSLIKIYNAKTDMKTQKIDADFFVKIDDKDLKGRIKGTLNHPKVNIKTSSYISNKIEKEIDKRVPQKFKEPLKNLLNLFD